MLYLNKTVTANEMQIADEQCLQPANDSAELKICFYPRADSDRRGRQRPNLFSVAGYDRRIKQRRYCQRE